MLLYGSETWTLTATKLREVRGFHHRATRNITGIHIRVDDNGNWIIPRSKYVLKEAGLLEIDEYIQRRRGYLARFTQERAILQRCETTPPHYGNPKQVVWWHLDNQTPHHLTTLDDQVGW